MFVDIHTHSALKSEFPAIRNLTLREAASLLNSSESGLFSLGIHPWDVHTFTENDFSDLKKYLTDSRIVLIGECGLDKHSEATLEKQLQVFKLQIELSEKLRKPLIIHCVGCFNELFELKKKLKPAQRWIIHGFRAKPELASQALKNGFYLSFGEHYNPESLALTPPDKLFVETDESLLPIEMIYKKIALEKNTDASEMNAGLELLKQINANLAQI